MMTYGKFNESPSLVVRNLDCHWTSILLFQQLISVGLCRFFGYNLPANWTIIWAYFKGKIFIKHNFRIIKIHAIKIQFLFRKSWPKSPYEVSVLLVWKVVGWIKRVNVWHNRGMQCALTSRLSCIGPMSNCPRMHCSLCCLLAGWMELQYFVYSKNESPEFANLPNRECNKGAESHYNERVVECRIAAQVIAKRSGCLAANGQREWHSIRTLRDAATLLGWITSTFIIKRKNILNFWWYSLPTCIIRISW